MNDAILELKKTYKQIKYDKSQSSHLMLSLSRVISINKTSVKPEEKSFMCCVFKDKKERFIACLLSASKKPTTTYSTIY